MDLTRPRRTNGLNPPYTPAQVATWVFLPLLCLEFLFFVTPLLPLAASIPCTIFFMASAFASVFYAYTAMKIDPADPRLCTSVTTRNNNSEATKQCWICDIQVGEKSMHCKFCNKCVDHFDHHCMWLNTCVGKANYRYFFRTMVWIAIMLFAHASIQLSLVVDIFVGQGNTKSRAEDWFQAGTEVPVLVVLFVFLVFDIGALSLIGQLLFFHIKLQKEGLTTYAYIVRDNQRRREKTKSENELAVKREVEIAKAAEEGRHCWRAKLQMGGCIREKLGIAACDPLKQPESADETGLEGQDEE